MQGRVPPAVDLEHLLACREGEGGSGAEGPGWGRRPALSGGPCLRSREGHAETEAVLWISGGRVGLHCWVVLSVSGGVTKPFLL